MDATDAQRALGNAARYAVESSSNDTGIAGCNGERNAATPLTTVGQELTRLLRSRLTAWRCSQLPSQLLLLLLPLLLLLLPLLLLLLLPLLLLLLLLLLQLLLPLRWRWHS